MFESLLEWVEENQTMLIWSTAVSIVVLVGTLIGTGWVIVRMPPDYFTNEEKQKTRNRALRIAKNVIGAIFLIGGLAMLILPGQGVLAIIVGVMLVDFPGKQRVLRWLILKPRVFKTMNWVRKKFDKEPLEKPNSKSDAKTA